jgi:hypothetical protein
MIIVVMDCCRAYSQSGYPKGWFNEKRITKDFLFYYYVYYFMIIGAIGRVSLTKIHGKKN